MNLSTNVDIHLLMVAENSLSTVLDHEGYRSVGIQAHIASHFADMKKALAKRKIDVVLIDWEYGRINPFEVVNFIRSNSFYKDLPIVVTSIHSCDDRIQNFKDIDLFVKQPVPRVLFLERIRRLLNRKTRENERVALHDFYLGSVAVQVGTQQLKMSLADISVTGLFLYSETALQTEENVQVKFSLPGLEKPLQINGKVVRTTRMHKINDKMNKGIAIQFTEFLGNAQDSLNTFFNKNKPDSNFMAYYL